MLIYVTAQRKFCHENQSQVQTIVLVVPTYPTFVDDGQVVDLNVIVKEHVK